MLVLVLSRAATVLVLVIEWGQKSGNVFSGLTTKAIATSGEPTRRVGFTGNVLRDVESDHESLVESVIASNIEG